MPIVFRLFPVFLPLKGFIEKIWLFESSSRLPGDDLKLIVPDGRSLLLIPYRNGLMGKMGGKEYVAKENKITLVGICDNPSVVDSQTDAATGSIGVQFSPLGLYRFFHIHLKDIKNDLNYLTDLLGKTAKDIEQQITDAETAGEKVRLIQSYLLFLFKKENDTLFEYCIQQIEMSYGGISMKQLEKLTGYSNRWLNLKFEERLGLSPKNFSSVIRFQNYYKAILSDTYKFRSIKPYYDHYYDESHFIKDFKRFTGMPPSRLIESSNKFGRLF
jgi:AraC-like DNA-binding protein